MFQVLKISRVFGRQTSLIRKRIQIHNTRCLCILPSKKWNANLKNGPGVHFLKIRPESQVILFRHYSSSLPEHVKLTLPALSPTMETGTIISWQKNVGDKVNDGDILAEIETDKAVMAWDTSEEGYVAKIFVEAGTKNLAIGTLLCIVVPEESDIAAFKEIKPEDVSATETKPPPAAVAPTPAAPQPPPVPPPQPQSSVTQTPQPTLSQGRTFASPLAKKLAAEQGLSLAGVAGSGPGGRVRSNDLSAAVPSMAIPTGPAVAVTTPGLEYTDISLTNMRQVIAKRLLQSKQTIPHYYLSIDINMDHIHQLRETLNNSLQRDEIKLSYNDFIIKAASLSCRKVPDTNAAWMDDFIRQYHSVDMCVAVATDGGLITPIIFSADKKGLVEINANVKALAEKARTGKLAPHEFQGGTFTISNLGMFGVKNFSAVINPPQVCILAVGSTQSQVIPDRATGHRVSDVMSVTLSCDHRVVDGAVGAEWLAVFKRYLEFPETMLL